MHRLLLARFYNKKFFNKTKPTSDMAGTSGGYTDLKDDILKLKREFEVNFSKNEASKANDDIKIFKFIAILGQGAFGVVVSHNFDHLQ